MRRGVLICLALLISLAAGLLLGTSARRDEIVDGFAAVDRSVVRVLIVGPDGRGSGSGFVVNSDGVVATNFHVVARAVSSGWSITVPDRADAVPLPAEIVATFPGEDLALLRVPGLDRPPVLFAPPDGTSVKGREVAVLGFPGAADRLGPISDPSLGVGSVARLFDGAWSMGGPRIPIIQHSAPTNPGNSGGPLVDRCGIVIGVNSQREVRILLGPGGVPVVTEQIQGVFYASAVAPLIERLREAGIAHQVATESCQRVGARGGVAVGSLLAVVALVLGVAALARGRRRPHDILIECRSSAEDCARTVVLMLGRLKSGGRLSVRRRPDSRADP